MLHGAPTHLPDPRRRSWTPGVAVIAVSASSSRPALDTPGEGDLRRGLLDSSGDGADDRGIQQFWLASMLHYLRSGRKPARTSSDKSAGCSQAAKCPPLLCLL